MARAESPTLEQLDRSKIDFTPEFPSIIFFIALILAAPVDLYLAYRAFTSDTRFANIIGILVIGAMIGLVMLAVSQTGQGMVGCFETQATGKEIHDKVVQLFAPAGWVLNGSIDTEIWYSANHGPKVWAIALLSLFGFFPAIIYYVIARNEQVAHIAWTVQNTGWTLVEVGVTPQRPHGRKIVKWLHSRLGA